MYVKKPREWLFLDANGGGYRTRARSKNFQIYNLKESNVVENKILNKYRISLQLKKIIPKNLKNGYF